MYTSVDIGSRYITLHSQPRTVMAEDTLANIERVRRSLVKRRGILRNLIASSAIQDLTQIDTGDEKLNLTAVEKDLVKASRGISDKLKNYLSVIPDLCQAIKPLRALDPDAHMAQLKAYETEVDESSDFQMSAEDTVSDLNSVLDIIQTRMRDKLCISTQEERDREFNLKRDLAWAESKRKDKEAEERARLAANPPKPAPNS